ncbi:AMP-binding protein [Aliifodinibius sp. S!AR15-10]|uniref:AMP-binding protein n=1 Tax=Aliifodinibius sp. S!AR15-10 TaxID=2950437 RepID=UPI00285FDC3B|nr:AMP-binding protein [Aliifodinibius sp. S!AR15-10]MDR8394001.1 AMP-binding protein [Aliifodinibius sp. S!AR15-10]
MFGTDIVEQANRYVPPNMVAYDEVYKAFRWNKYISELSGLPNREGLNIAYEAVDRHAAGKLRNKIAMRWLGDDGTTEEFSYQKLKEETGRFANILQSLGVEEGEVVATLTGRIPGLFIAALGAMKTRSLFCPIPAGDTRESIWSCLEQANPKVLVTTGALYREKVEPALDQLENLQHVLLVDEMERRDPMIESMPLLMRQADKMFDLPPTDPDDPAMVQFSSGSSGPPKGVIHTHKSALIHYITGKFVLDFHADDIFWCTAAPGWAPCTFYGMLSPLLHGVTSLVVEGDLEPHLCYQILEEQMVSVWYTTPVILQKLMHEDIDVGKQYNLNALRLIHSTGGPVRPQIQRWSQETLELPILDTWGQAETGGIMIANYPGMRIKPGAMGKPLPGIKAAIVKTDESGELTFIEEPGETGQLALKTGWPSMFAGYVEGEYKQRFAGGWYLTGDLVHRDEQGYFWFGGRMEQTLLLEADEVTSFEIEQVLMTHPAILEAAVVAEKEADPKAILYAYIAVKAGCQPDEDLAMEIKSFAGEQLDLIPAGLKIEFMRRLPKTPSGTIRRYKLRDREYKLPLSM